MPRERGLLDHQHPFDPPAGEPRRADLRRIDPPPVVHMVLAYRVKHYLTPTPDLVHRSEPACGTRCARGLAATGAAE